MCQITPFTLPCCRRFYVSIGKLPSCPGAWPRSKCPPELCIQLGGFEAAYADHKQIGICWRCRAVLDGTVGHDRECLRPGIDNAVIVPGLEELGPADRRKLAEAEGKCWHCGTKGCHMCDGKKSVVQVDEKSGILGKRARNWKGKSVRKRLNTGKLPSMMQIPPIVQTSSPMASNSSIQPFPRYYSHQPYFNSAGPCETAQDGPQGLFVNPVDDSNFSIVNSSGSAREAQLGSLYDPSQDSNFPYSANIDPALLSWQPEQYPNGCQSTVLIEPQSGSELAEGQSYTGVSAYDSTPAVQGPSTSDERSMLDLSQILNPYTNDFPSLQL